MFRYDRPQAGRYRQFWQFDVEAIGDPGPAVDAEIVELGSRFFRDAGLADVEVSLNSIGDSACRPAYIEGLTAYYRERADRLPPTERDRLARSPLRLLDSKDPAMAELNAAAPRITEHLCEACADHFAAVQAHLTALGVRVPPRAGLGARAGLLHPHRLRVLRRRPRGPAAGARRRRPLRRARRAARRPADARDRVRDRPRPGAPRARGDRCRERRRRAIAGRGRGRRGPGGHLGPAGDRHGPARRRDRGAGPSCRGASWASSSRRPPATGRISR